MASKSSCGSNPVQIVNLDDEDDDVEILQNPAQTKVIPAALKFPQIKEGDKVYAPERGAVDPWRPAVVQKVIDRYNNDMATVTYEDGRRKLKKPTVTRSLSHLAYFEEKPHVFEYIPIGIRVIAKTQISKHHGQTYYSGIVAESPILLNKKRYLIIFDTGDVKYIEKEFIRRMCRHDPQTPPWAFMNIDIQSFVKKYLQLAPQFPLARTRKFSIIQVEWNGMWWPARVIEIDCSLVQMELVENSLTFWLYRGSERILENNAKAQNEIRKYKSKVRSGLKPKKLNYGEEYEGKVEQRSIPKHYLTLRKVKDASHICSQSCSPTPIFPQQKSVLKDVSPLAAPFYFGWDRRTKESEGRKKVYYVTPCGRELDQLTQINKFLNITSSPLHIDAFCLDPVVDCLAEFKPRAECFVYEKDIADGTEKVGIERVNAVDLEFAPPFVYVSSSVVDSGVYSHKAEKEDDFLVGCDCEDNCMDKSKCSCSKLTDAEGLGYENRRLFDEFRGGLFECNEKCKCSAACHNKVVQHGLNYKLQVFKTSKKDYAIRAMQDIPAGAFLSTYNGEIIDSTLANEHGANNENSDMYLFNLDMIEHHQNNKPGYESDVVEPEEPEVELESRQIKHAKRATKPDVEKDVSSLETSEVIVDLEMLQIDANVKKCPTARKSSCNVQEMKKRKREGIGKKCTKSERSRLFGEDEDIYVVNSMYMGNLSRYFNHSCEPNSWAQNVFVNTHDLRFPSCAFFTNKAVKCGNELNINYHYVKGSVEGKSLVCNCGAMSCDGVLL